MPTNKTTLHITANYVLGLSIADSSLHPPIDTIQNTYLQLNLEDLHTPCHPKLQDNTSAHSHDIMHITNTGVFVSTWLKILIV